MEQFEFMPTRITQFPSIWNIINFCLKNRLIFFFIKDNGSFCLEVNPPKYNQITNRENPHSVGTIKQPPQ